MKMRIDDRSDTCICHDKNIDSHKILFLTILNSFILLKFVLSFLVSSYSIQYICAALYCIA